MSRFPARYREVSVADVDVPLKLDALTALLTSRPVYRRTRYIVVRNGDSIALVEVRAAVTRALFYDVVDVLLLAEPDETVYVHRPDLDTAVPSELVKAAEDAPGSRCVVVEGRYGHVSFVLDPSPVRIRIVDVAPPWPAKLVDQVDRMLQTADDMPDVVTWSHVIELPDLLPETASGHYLLQCRGGGMEVPGASVSYLDEVPPKQDWTLLGCARSRAIHDALYGGPLRQIDTCPRTLTRDMHTSAEEVLLIKCCLLEEHVERDGRTIVVPWGASFGHLREGVQAAIDVARDEEKLLTSDEEAP